ncbi:MAG TPA: hypothetical protein VH325_02775 [Bryobacteraceae bacterium]|nr:hypothetical protein [Bryobacteraceae bacterium]
MPSIQQCELGRRFRARSARCGLRLTLFPIASAVLLWAIPPWLNKDFKDWTEKDVSALMSNSPWAKAMPLPSTDRPSQVIVEGSPSSGPPATAGLGTNNAGNTSNSGSGPGSEGPNPTTARTTVLTPSTLAQSTGAPAIQPTVTIIWASALPIRLGQLKMRSHGATPTDDQMATALKPRENYTIVVLGLPEPNDLAQVDALAATASLNAHGKDLPCSKSEFRKFDNRNIYIFRFPKTSQFSLDDREAEFRVTLGRMQIKKKFDLRDMVYQGKLEL